MSNPLDETRTKLTLDEVYDKLIGPDPLDEDDWADYIHDHCLLEREARAQWSEKQSKAGKLE